MILKNIDAVLILDNAKKILIIRLSSLGDVILTTPLIRSLKNFLPKVIIEYVVREEYEDILINNPYISKIFTFTKDENRNKELTANLANNNYDAVIDLQNNFRSARLINALNCSVFKFNKRSLDKFLLVKFKINKLKDAPTIPVRYAKTINLKLDDEGLDIISYNSPSEILEGNKSYIGIAPGSRHFTKMWPAEYFTELGKLINKTGKKIVLFGGTSDIEICKTLNKEIPGSINLCNQNDILQTVVDMKKCETVICNDSGLMHAACAAKVPVLTIFGSTVKEFGFVPYNNRNFILENNSLTCRPCTHIGRAECPKRHFKCMLELTPQSAFENLKHLQNS